ncbi:hypothetical protein [Parasedimentitalea psychrophila]|uniref:Uncharacterized protein n=1 Tax=Parasedimentitalea psychrophila TaxID=2997337 RepID=A0A9Y2P3Q0_9RHOB|nr:hypothetical protein [Parasedimentitalea psychrophila]WIY24509.1 hypothetical protein QPJ95_18465 [Parasedimentitalea psychrophila]
MQSDFPIATPHGEIRQIFKDVFIVTGSVMMVPGIQLSRNMIILREGEALTLISTVRLNDQGLKALEALGRVENIVKLGAYHLGVHNGLDDPFYVDRYAANLWAVDGMQHRGGLRTTHSLRPGGEMPVTQASLFTYDSSKMPEGMLLLHKEGGVLVSADSLQNWAEVDEFFSKNAAIRMQQAGFIKPANIGPEWLRVCQPEPKEFARVAELDFAHLIPSHGTPILNTAKEEFQTTFAKQPF